MRPRRLLAAPNALKGSLSAFDAARAIAEGARRALPELDVIEMPIADGGDGTRAVLVSALGGEERELRVEDPLGRPTAAQFGVLAARNAAVVDVATASGLALLGTSERDPLRASSFGTGELLRAALETGRESILLGVGGSATVDGGAGLLEALGVRFLDAAGAPIARGGAGLLDLARIDTSGLIDAARRARWIVACDVDNPLLGPDGAARVFAPQKGADAAATALLETALERLAAVLAVTTGQRLDGARGGAAGGIAATLAAVLGAELVAGVDLVLDWVGFDRALAGTDLVVTAEGRLDAQSLRHKGPVGVARRAASFGVPTVALAGAVAADLDTEATPFAAVLPIASAPATLEESCAHAAPWLARAAERALRLVALGTEIAHARTSGAPRR